MTIINDDETEYVTPPAAETPNDPVRAVQPNVVPDIKRSAIVDSRFESYGNLLTYVEGAPWPNTYYSRVVGPDDELTQNQPGQHPVYQQYIKIDPFEIRIQDTLSQTLDSENNEMRVTGSSTTYPKFIPNVGDTFIADMGDGTEGVFGVTKAERKSIFNESVFGIEYFLIMKGTAVNERRLDLESKVIKTLVFKKEHLQTGNNAFLEEATAVSYDKLGIWYDHLVRNYMVEFFDRNTKTVKGPFADTVVYDDYLTMFLLKVIEEDRYPTLSQITRMNVSFAESVSILTFWDALMDMDSTVLRLVTDRMWLVNTSAYGRTPAFASVRYTGIDQVVFPHGFVPNGVTFTPTEGGGLPMYPTPTTPVVYPPLNSYDLTVSNPQAINPPAIHPVDKDAYYVFSQAFYQNASTGQSAIELFIRKAINREEIDPLWVIELADKSSTWSPQDRYYYLPIVIALIKITKLFM